MKDKSKVLKMYGYHYMFKSQNAKRALMFILRFKHEKKEPPTNVSDSVFYLNLPVFQIMSLEGAFFRSYKLHRS